MFGFHVKVQEILRSGFILHVPEWNRELFVCPGGEMLRGQGSGLYGFRVCLYCVLDRVLIQVREIVSIFYSDDSFSQINGLKPHVLVGFFYLG